MKRSLLAFLARPASTLLSIETVAGRHLYALPAEAARAGFLLSPQIVTPGVFASLYNSQHADPATTVRSIAVVQSDRGRKLSRPIISFRFYRLRLAHR